MGRTKSLQDEQHRFQSPASLCCNFFCLHMLALPERGPEFVSQVWRGFCQGTGATDSLTSGFHPQSNGPTGRENQDLEKSLRCMVLANPVSWSNFPMPPTPWSPSVSLSGERVGSTIHSAASSALSEDMSVFILSGFNVSSLLGVSVSPCVFPDRRLVWSWPELEPLTCSPAINGPHWPSTPLVHKSSL